MRRRACPHRGTTSRSTGWASGRRASVITPAVSGSYFGDPDVGIFMTTAVDPRGPWEPLTLVHAARGWIDPCPLWDDDGAMYLVHAWAKSRAGFNSVLTLRRLSADGRSVLAAIR